MKAISGVLFLLLKHFKLNHVYQVRFVKHEIHSVGCMDLWL